MLGHKAAPSPVHVAGCHQQTRNCAQGSRAADHFCPHTAEISAVTRSLHDTSLLGLPFLMYSSLAPAGTCPAKVSELQMDIAFADRRTLIPAVWRGRLQSPQSFSTGWRGHHKPNTFCGKRKAIIHSAVAQNLLYLGEMLTSKIQGLRFSSSMISNPNSSWQQYGRRTYIFTRLFT